MVDEKYSLNKFSDKRESIITKIDGNLKFPESMEGNKSKSIGELNCPFNFLSYFSCCHRLLILI